MRFTSEQNQLRDTLRKFFRENLNSSYIRQRCENNDPSDLKFTAEINKLGLRDFFSDSDSNAGMTELGILASESGYCLLPEFLFEKLFSEIYIFKNSDLPDLKGRSLSYAGYCSEIPDISASKNTDKLLLKTVAPADFVIFRALKEKEEKIFYAPVTNQLKTEFLDLSLKYENAEVMISDAREIKGLDPERIQAEYFTLVSCMLAGAVRKVLDMSVEYVRTRKQFDQVIGGFQAVQHHMAEMQLKSESLKALSEFACFACVSSPGQIFIAAQSAIRYASEAAVEVAEKAIQVHGGIGFTWEYDLHLFLRRIKTQQALCTVMNSAIYMDRYLKQLNTAL